MTDKAEKDARERIVLWICSTCGEAKTLRDGDKRPDCIGAGPFHTPTPMWARPLVPELALATSQAKLAAALEQRDDYKQGVEAGAILLREAERERDEWKTQHGYAMEGQESWQFTAKQNLERAERAEAALAEALDAFAELIEASEAVVPFSGVPANGRFNMARVAARSFLREHGRLLS